MKLVNITDEKLYEKLGCTSTDRGVYSYHAVDNNLLPVPLNRILKPDPNGTLYIGHTPKRTLFVRIADFRKCVLEGYKGTGHSAGNTYNAIKKLKENFPPDKIAVQIRVFEITGEQEKKLIDEYRQEFGEVPPLNSY